MQQFEFYESIHIHLDQSSRLACHSKAGKNDKVPWIDTFYPKDNGFGLTVLDMINKKLLHFDIELDLTYGVANVSYLGLIVLPEEVEDFVDASVKRMAKKLENNRKLRERRESERHMPPELRKGFTRKHWRGFFVEYLTQSKPKLDNELALTMGHATQEMIDHLESLGLGFTYYCSEILETA